MPCARAFCFVCLPGAVVCGQFLQGFLRAMTRPAGRVKGVSKSRGSGRVGSLRFKIKILRVGSGQKVSKSRGSGRVGLGDFQNLARVGSGQVERFQNLAGRLMSGQELFKISRVGSDHDPRDTGHSQVKPPRPAGCFWLARRSNPRIWPAGSPFSNL